MPEVWPTNPTVSESCRWSPKAHFHAHSLHDSPPMFAYVYSGRSYVRRRRVGGILG